MRVLNIGQLITPGMVKTSIGKLPKVMKMDYSLGFDLGIAIIGSDTLLVDGENVKYKAEVNLECSQYCGEGEPRSFDTTIFNVMGVKTSTAYFRRGGNETKVTWTNQQEESKSGEAIFDSQNGNLKSVTIITNFPEGSLNRRAKVDPGNEQHEQLAVNLYNIHSKVFNQVIAAKS